MATTKSDSKPDDAKTEAKSEPKREAKASARTADADASFRERAAAFAADLRTAAEEIGKRLEELGEQRDTVMQGSAPEIADEAAADVLRRLPMPLNEATRAVAALGSIGADLGSKAV